jgi:hypothetical protein
MAEVESVEWDGIRDIDEPRQGSRERIRLRHC